MATPWSNGRITTIRFGGRRGLLGGHQGKRFRRDPFFDTRRREILEKVLEREFKEESRILQMRNAI